MLISIEPMCGEFLGVILFTGATSGVHGRPGALAFSKISLTKIEVRQSLRHLVFEGVEVVQGLLDAAVPERLLCHQ